MVMENYITTVFSAINFISMQMYEWTPLNSLEKLNVIFVKTGLFWFIYNYFAVWFDVH